MSDTEFLENILRISCPLLLKKLQPGLSQHYMDTLLSDSQLCYNEVKKIYAWRNGTEKEFQPTFLKNSFHYCGNFLSLENAISVYKDFEAKGFWDFNLFPILSNNDGEYLLLDVENMSPTYGMLFISSTSLLISPPETIYDSFSSFVKTLSHCYASKSYVYKKRTNELEINFVHERAFSAVFNPNSEFWNRE